jgi:hypothetical protein
VSYVYTFMACAHCTVPTVSLSICSCISGALSFPYNGSDTDSQRHAPFSIPRGRFSTGVTCTISTVCEEISERKTKEKLT